MLNNIKIGLRLGTGLVLLILLLTSVIILGINRMDILSEQTEMMYNHPLTVSNAVLRINTNIVKIHRNMKDVVLAQDIADIEESSRIVNRREEEVYKDFEIINKRFLGEKEKYEKALKVFTEWKTIREEVISLMRIGKRIEAANITKGKGALHVVKIEEAMEILGDFAQTKAKGFLQTTEDVKHRTLNEMYLLLVVSIIIGITFAFFLTRSITRPIATLRIATDEIGKGKLDTKIDIKTGDEIGDLSRAFNQMLEDLKTSTTSIDNLSKEITERKLAEEGLRQYEHIISSSTDMMALLDKRFMYIAANQAYLNAFGKTSDEIIGHTVSQVFGEEFFEAVIKPNALRCFAGEEVNYQTWYKFPSTERKYMDVTYYPYTDADNNIKGFVVNGRDFTERRKVEDALRKSKEYLLQANKQIREKSDKLENANRLLKEMDKTKTDFLDMVAHDLRNPLTAVRSYSDLLLRYWDPSNKVHKEYVEIIKKESIRLSNLINDYLDFSKIEAGKLDFKEEQFDIRELIDYFVKLYQGVGEAKQIMISSEVEKDLPIIKGDREKLGQVFSNLLGNSIKFTPHEGFIKIKASSIRIQKEGIGKSFVKISIVDTGIGISKDLLGKIFDKFGWENHKSNIDGHGLGLFISKAIIEKHGGNMEVESKKGTGTTFSFTLKALDKGTENTGYILTKKE